MPRTRLIIAILAVVFAVGAFEDCPTYGQATTRPAPDNPNIDMAGHLRVSNEAAEHRESRRVSEQQFLQMSREPGTLVLDARSKQKFDELHIKGATNLSFPDITIESLASTIPDKNTRILIYCNNNFRNSERAFPSKLPAASLNLSTYIALYNYGYRNVYELGPQLDPASSILTFESAAPRRIQVDADRRDGAK
jgi:phage shock protein E